MEKAYKTYENSGVEWIGEIPNNWIATKFKYFAIIKNGKDQKKVIADNGKYPILGTGGEFGRSNKYLYNKPSVLLGRKGTIDKPQFITEPFWTVDTLFYTEIKKDVSPKFLYYVSTTFPFSFLQESSAVPSMTQGKLNDLYIARPSFSEQTQIAAYLDYHTQRIDTLISKKETLIQKLQEQRQAIINEAATKGLNKNVAFKDSGIEWLGEIPEHWEVVKFIRFCNLQQGLQIPISQRVLDKIEGALEYITTKSIHNPDDYRQYVVGAKQSVICNEDEVLLGRTGNTGEVVTGVSGVFHNNFFKINFNQDFITKDYLVHYLNTSFIQELIGIEAGTTTIPDLNHGDFLNLPFIMPPVKEQIEIVERINSKYQIIDKSITNIQVSIQKLKAYRQSLISEAVTGKIDVRDWEQPNN